MFKFEELRNIHIELTTKCNARCGNCPRNFFGSKKHSWIKDTEYTISEFKKYFSHEVLSQVKFILLCGSYGDPAACSDLEEIIEYLMSYDLEVQINSNMSLRSKESWKRIGKSLNEKSQIVLSIDGLEDTNHLYRRGTRWNKIEENVQALRGTKANVVWECLLFSHNIAQKEEINRKAKEWGIPTVLFKNPMGFKVDDNGVRYMPLLDSSGRVESLLYPHDQDVSRVYDLKLKLNINIIEHIQSDEYSPKEYRVKESSHEHSIECRSLKENEVYIDGNKNVYPCCFFGSYDNPEQFDQQLLDYLYSIDRSKISLKNSTLKDILNNQTYSQVEKSWSCQNYSDGKLKICERYCSKKEGEVFHLYEKE